MYSLSAPMCTPRWREDNGPSHLPQTCKQVSTKTVQLCKASSYLQLLGKEFLERVSEVWWAKQVELLNKQVPAQIKLPYIYEHIE